MEATKILLSAAVVCLLVVTFSMCDEDDKRHQLHMKRLGAYPCATPRPTVLELDVLGINETAYKYVQPKNTVLHTCAGSGCCNRFIKKMQCLPKSSELVPLVFKMTTFNNEIIFRTVNYANHTSCSCQQNNPK